MGGILLPLLTALMRLSHKKERVIMEDIILKLDGAIRALGTISVRGRQDCLNMSATIDILEQVKTEMLKQYQGLHATAEKETK